MKKRILPIFLIVLGIFIFVFGGYDDSPGAQLLGAVVCAMGIYRIARRRR